MQAVTIELLLEIHQFPFGADDLHPLAVEHSDSCAVVSAILQLSQTFNEYGHDIARSDVTDDSAHSENPFPTPRSGQSEPALEWRAGTLARP